MSEKIYSYKDFKSVKSKDYWNVGCFDENMYAVSHYQFGSSAGNGYICSDYTENTATFTKEKYNKI